MSKNIPKNPETFINPPKYHKLSQNVPKCPERCQHIQKSQNVTKGPETSKNIQNNQKIFHIVQKHNKKH